MALCNQRRTSSDYIGLDLVAEMLAMKTNRLTAVVSPFGESCDSIVCFLKHKFSEIWRAPLSLGLIELRVEVAKTSSEKQSMKVKRSREDDDEYLENFLYEYVHEGLKESKNEDFG